MRLARAARSAIAAAFVLLVAGCSAPEGQSSAPPLDDPIVAELYAAARDGGASAAQLEVIVRGPEVSFSDYERAVHLSLECMQDAGIDVVNTSPQDYRGFPEIRYSFAASSEGRTDDETLEVADACMETHSRWIESLYQNSPSSVEAVEAAFEPHRAALIACLEDEGQTVPESATYDDLMLATFEVQDAGGPDCWAQSGAPR